jgi:DNA-binding NarL/FixJ family response regulator
MTKKTPDIHIHNSVRAVAEHLREAGLPTSPSTVWRVEKATRGGRVGLSLGRDGKLRPDRRIDTTARDTEIYRLYADGDDIGPMSMREIAAQVGCSVGTVHRVIKKLEDES